jgi:hypothetical protein
MRIANGSNWSLIYHPVDEINFRFLGHGSARTRPSRLARCGRGKHRFLFYFLFIPSADDHPFYFLLALVTGNTAGEVFGVLHPLIDNARIFQNGTRDCESITGGPEMLFHDRGSPPAADTNYGDSPFTTDSRADFGGGLGKIGLSVFTLFPRPGEPCRPQLRAGSRRASRNRQCLYSRLSQPLRKENDIIVRYAAFNPIFAVELGYCRPVAGRFADRF